uniref:Serine carboxypeptidase n=1 Tax=Rhipicephalus zambeziensis TaxID=60191 RepID=A0A224YYY6_9ACAR
MLDEQGRTAMSTQFTKILQAAARNTTIAAFMLAKTVFNLRMDGEKSLFANLTGYDDQESVLHTTKDAEVEQYMKYVNDSKVKEQLGIPIPDKVSLEKYRPAINLHLAPGDYFNNITDMFERVLGSQKVLILNGQMDDIFPPVLFEEYFRKMTWTGSAEFKEAPRMPWKMEDMQYGLTGYVKQCGNLTTALALRAGHYVGFHASEAVYYAVKRFIEGHKYSDGVENSINQGQPSLPSS